MLRESSPLTRSGRLFRFVHQSIQEYFFSRTSLNPSIRHNNDDSSQQPVPDATDIQLLDIDGPLFKRSLLSEPAVGQFLCERVQKHSGYKNQLLAIIQQSKTDGSAAIGATNAITILARAGSPSMELTFLAASLIRVYAFTYSPNGKKFAVTQEGANIGIYDAATWISTRQLELRRSKVLCAAFSPDSQEITFGDNNMVRVWDFASGKSMRYSERLGDHTNTVRSVAFSPCRKQLVSTSRDARVLIWSLEARKVLFTFRDHTNNVSSVKCSPDDGQRIAVGHSNGYVQLWSAITEEVGAVLKGHTAFVTSFAFSHNGLWVASANGDHSVKLWDVSAGTLISVFAGHAYGVRDVTFSLNSQQTSAGGTMGPCNSEMFAQVYLERLSHATQAITEDSPCSHWVTSANAEVALLWDLREGHVVVDLRGTKGPYCCGVAFSQGATPQLAIADSLGKVQLFDPRTRIIVKETWLMKARASAMSYSLDGQQLVIGSEGGFIYMSDLLSDVHSIELNERKGGITSLIYSSGDQWVVAGFDDKIVRVMQKHPAGDEESGVGRSCVAVVNALYAKVNSIGWGSTESLEFLCASDMTFKDVVSLDGINQKLLIQRGVIEQPSASDHSAHTLSPRHPSHLTADNCMIHMNYGQQPKSVLETYIERACDPSRYEPDLALNLEICDVIKEKQKNTPREAAVYIVRLINNRNLHVSMLALALLDNCVKNCGYPFHLQIATKEFLNELVRKFPERPLAVCTPAQNRILELIQEWYQTLCKSSRYKEDLVHIKDMHRLLSYKGYRFPQLKGDSASVLNPVNTLKSPAELEEEDRAAQSAKLQELIRRGRPEDVVAANELVKKMTGYEQEEKPDYEEEASSELDKILIKAVLLTEMLNEVKPGESIGRGDKFEELLSTCKAAQPKVQKFIGEASDDDDMEKLLQINDVINNVIEQYNQVKSGRLVKSVVPSVGHGDNRNTGSSGAPAQSESSLIDLVDFGGPDDNSSPTTTSAAPAPPTTGNLMDDLMSLNFNDGPPPAWGAAGSIALGRSISPAASFNSNSSSSFNAGAPPGYSVFSSSSGGNNTSNSGSPAFSNSPMMQSISSSSNANASSGFDDFDFVSNTGATQSGPTTVALLNKNGLLIELDIEYVVPGDVSSIKAVAHFSNAHSSAMSSLTFRVAVPKSLQLQLNPQSGQVLAPFSKRSVAQSLSINNPTRQQPVRIKYHVSYVVDGRTIEEQGEFNQFPMV
ncbi:hypothetical protein BGZ47_011258 [Haplosporangium gracile]|nr:hypothetical protein BGZ47_011258 [Haplosporangium gracile]